MTLLSQNGNGAAVAILPPTTKTITGASLVHRRLSKTQRAVLAADVIDGLARYVQTNQQVATAFGVSQTYIDIARKLPPGKREAILRGWDPTSFAELMHPPRQLSLAMPVIPTVKVITDTDLENLVRCVGTERLINAAVAVERAA
jgi:hypothetical protein